LQREIRVTIESDEEGVFVAKCPGLSAVFPKGKRARRRWRIFVSAIQGYPGSLKHGEPIPAIS
jgi:hypothetical protein